MTIWNLATIVTPDADPARAQRNAGRAGAFFFLEQERFRAVDTIPPLVSASSHSLSAFTRQVGGCTSGSCPVRRQTWGRRSCTPTLPGRAGIRGDLRRRGAGNWSPVHRFCERAKVPCLFPNVQLPVVAEGDFYPIYFSRGVAAGGRPDPRCIGLVLRRARRRRVPSGCIAGETSVKRRQRAAPKSVSQALGRLDRSATGAGPRGRRRPGGTGLGAKRAILSFCGLRSDDLSELPVDPPQKRSCVRIPA